MNCKPGDLAIVVCCEVDDYVGRIIRVHHVLPIIEEFAPFWYFTGADSMEWEFSNGISDACLKPLRDPGDDAVDESKAWLPPVPLPKIDPSLLPEKESA